MPRPPPAAAGARLQERAGGEGGGGAGGGGAMCSPPCVSTPCTSGEVDGGGARVAERRRERPLLRERGVGERRPREERGRQRPRCSDAHAGTDAAATACAGDIRRRPAGADLPPRRGAAQRARRRVPDGAKSGAAASPATERACAQPCSSERRCSPAIWSSRDAEFCFSCSSCELSEWSVCMCRPNSSMPAAAILAT